MSVRTRTASYNTRRVAKKWALSRAIWHAAPGMRLVIIGAGRGSRLKHRTDDVPKTLVPVMGRPMLEWILEAQRAAGFEDRDVVFVCGYKAEIIQARYPRFTYVVNEEWETNNILASLMKARAYLVGGFVSTYSDIVYTPAAARGAVETVGDKVLVCDTDWRRRYDGRTEHPETDAEKVRCEGPRVTRLSRRISPDEASGEFIGVTRFSERGAGELLEAYSRAAAAFSDDPDREYREGRSFRRAYLIDLFAEMLEAGSEFQVSRTHGGYMELDTLQDLALAERWWRGSRDP